MKLLTLLALLTVSLPLAGCPKKQSAEEAGVEKPEGSSSTDKSGEGSSDEMQEKKPEANPADAAPADAGTDDKKQ